MTASDSREVVQEYYGRLNRHDVEGAAELLTADCTVTVADAVVERDAYLELLWAWTAGFPDLANTLEQVVAEGSLVAVRSTWQGTHEGPFLGAPPTGRRVRFGAFSASRVREGRIAERWLLGNVLGVLQQIGDLAWTVRTSVEGAPRDVAMDVTAAFRAMPVGE